MRSVVAVGLALALVGMMACGGRSTSDDDRSNGGSSGASGTSPGSGGASGAGTSGASGAQTGGLAGVPNDWATACERVVATLCPRYEECTPFVFEAILTPDCPSYIGRPCNDLARLSDVRITPAGYAACIEAIARQSCDDFAYGGITPAECEGLTGSRPIGSPCGTGPQCQSGVCSPKGFTCGVCSLAPSREGESCLDTSCATGLACNQESVCVPGRRFGEPCNVDAPCRNTMSCQNGTCVRPPGEGAPCGDAALGCDLLQGLSCNDETGLCEKIPVAGPGETCTGYCRASTTCVPNAAGDYSICATSQRAGEPCPPGQEACDRWLTCRNGVCEAFDPTTCN